jgi:hypothetical protein
MASDISRPAPRRGRRSRWRADVEHKERPQALAYHRWLFAYLGVERDVLPLVRRHTARRPVRYIARQRARRRRIRAFERGALSQMQGQGCEVSWGMPRCCVPGCTGRGGRRRSMQPNTCPVSQYLPRTTLHTFEIERWIINTWDEVRAVALTQVGHRPTTYNVQASLYIDHIHVDSRCDACLLYRPCLRQSLHCSEGAREVADPKCTRMCTCVHPNIVDIVCHRNTRICGVMDGEARGSSGVILTTRSRDASDITELVD